MQIGKQITSFNHAQIWCLEQHNYVAIKTKKDGHFERHSYKVIKSMSFIGIYKLIIDGRLFELHE